MTTHQGAETRVPNTPPAPGCQRRSVTRIVNCYIMRALIFLALWAFVFAFATLKSQRGGLGFGTHSLSFYGWPQTWLTVDHRTQTTTIYADGRREGGEQWTEHRIHWQPFAVSVSAVAGIAAVLSVPFFFWPLRKPTKEYDHVV